MENKNNPEVALLDNVFEDNITFGKKGYRERTLTKEERELEDLYNKVEIKLARPGDIFNLKYIGTTKDSFLFEGDFKDYVRVDDRYQEKLVMSNLEVGEYIDVLITSNDKDGIIKGSVSSLHIKHVIGHILDSNPAGYTVDIIYQGNKMKCFMPNYLAGINKINDPKSLIGKKMEVILENYDNRRRTGVVSRRKYLESLIEEEIKTVEVGVEYIGNITDKTDYGVFVEFKQSLTGMIHKSNLAPDVKLSDMNPGDEIKFFIREIIESKIILTQVMKETVWDSIEVGQVHKGKVTVSNKKGFLVSLDDSTTGLIPHVDLEEIGAKISEGDKIKVEVLAFNKKYRIITLALR